eukprot:TRINITY_DN70869_c0_g1_i1.p2 TRINITY_DN70869_c0_g1~~TRINITY_DN70869_c0_g1_i1.p2  ORF type:complete len:345 (+),score=12.56 TRINITY_DN70869_c0_g1_i1:476-1510(+)
MISSAQCQILGLKPNASTYSGIILCYSSCGMVAEAENTLKEVLRKQIKPTSGMYTSLLNAYVKTKDTLTAEKVFAEMQEKGLVPDAAAYTSLIFVYQKANNWAKCWDIFKHADVRGCADQYLLSYMIRICSYVTFVFCQNQTNDAEKALRLFRRLEQSGMIEYSYPYNSLIMALASRKDYAQQAIETWRKMRYLQVVPDTMTFLAVLRATAKLGDLQTAYEAIQEMKAYEQPINRDIYESLIQTYAGACKVEGVTDKQIDAYIKDAWVLFRQMESKGFTVRQETLNSLLMLHANALREADVEGQILPLYKKYNLSPDTLTYMHLMSKAYLKCNYLSIRYVHNVP